MEEMIVNVWKEVLHANKIGIYDNFFDIGGNSLSIIKINTKINERLKRNIPVVEMFNHPTVHSLVRYLSQGGDTPLISSEEMIAEDINLFEEASRMLMENE
jgi:hypothetical protein